MHLKFTTILGNELLVKPKSIIAITPSEKHTTIKDNDISDGNIIPTGVVILEGGMAFEVKEPYEDVKELFVMYGR